MHGPDRSHALDHVVVVLFENRSLDNVLGHLYGPGDGREFDGVIGKDLSNPIPAWAEHGADRKVVPYRVATDMDSPNPDSGEEHFHTNTQLYNTLDDHNRFKIGEADRHRGTRRQRARRRRWTGSSPTTSPPSPVRSAASRVRRVRPHHDRLHPRVAAGAQWDRPGLRGLRPLVLRGAVPDLHEPVVLDRGHLVGLLVEQPDAASGSPRTTLKHSSSGSRPTAGPGRST